MIQEFLWIGLATIIGLGIASTVRSSRRGRRRRAEIVKTSRVITLSELAELKEPDACIVAVDFGFGFEAWYLPTPDESIDFSNTTYAKGLFLLPTPRFSELKEACARHNIRLRTVSVKRLSRPPDITTRRVASHLENSND